MSLDTIRLLPLLTILVTSVGSNFAAADEMDEWAPSFSIDTGVLIHGVNAGARPGQLQDFVFRGGDIVSFTSGEDFLFDTLLGGSLELMAPSVLDTPGGLRPFLRVGLGASFGPKHDVAKEDSPSRFRLPSGAFTFIQEQSIAGQGSATSVRYLPLAPSAAFGVALTLPWNDRTLRIKPSFEYMWQELTLRGVAKRAVARDPSGRGQSLNDFRLLELVADTDASYHMVGVGLELEVDAARTENVILTVFLGARLHALLGDLRTRFGAVDPAFGETSEWDVDLNRWRSSFVAGLRFRWLSSTED